MNSPNYQQDSLIKLCNDYPLLDPIYAAIKYLKSRKEIHKFYKDYLLRLKKNCYIIKPQETAAIQILAQLKNHSSIRSLYWLEVLKGLPKINFADHKTDGLTNTFILGNVVSHLVYQTLIQEISQTVGFKNFD